MGVRSWFSDTKDELTLALNARRAAKAIKKEIAMNHDWGKTLAAVAKDFAITSSAALVAFFAIPENLGAILGSLSPEARAALIPFLSGLFVMARKYIKHSVPPSAGGDLKKGALVGVLCLLSLSSPEFAFAQEPLPTPTPSGVQLTLHGGAMQFAERGQPDKRDFVYRLSLTIPAPSGLTLFARADYTRTQDGGDLLDPKTFRSIEGFVGGRKDIGSGFAVTAFGGATWNRDAKFEPTDARLYTAAAGVRFAVPGRGYVIAAAGHHGPVGGSAFLGSITYEINSGASWFADIAIPLDAARFEKRPYTAKAGISARLKGWNF